MWVFCKSKRCNTHSGETGTCARFQVKEETPQRRKTLYSAGRSPSRKGGGLEQRPVSATQRLLSRRWSDHSCCLGSAVTPLVSPGPSRPSRECTPHWGAPATLARDAASRGGSEDSHPAFVETTAGTVTSRRTGFVLLTVASRADAATLALRWLVVRPACLAVTPRVSGGTAGSTAGAPKPLPHLPEALTRKPGRPAQLCCSGRGLAWRPGCPAPCARRRLDILCITSLWAFKRFRSFSFSFRVRKSFFFRASKSKRA